MRRKFRNGSAFFAAWLTAGCLLCTQSAAGASSVQDEDMSPHSSELVAVDKDVNPDNVPGALNTTPVKIHAAILNVAHPHALRPRVPTDPIKRAAEIGEDLAATSPQADAIPGGQSSRPRFPLPSASHRLVGSNQSDVLYQMNAFVTALR
jgi:hypothetical protein